MSLILLEGSPFSNLHLGSNPRSLPAAFSGAAAQGPRHPLTLHSLPANTCRAASSQTDLTPRGPLNLCWTVSLGCWRHRVSHGRNLSFSPPDPDSLISLCSPVQVRSALPCQPHAGPACLHPHSIPSCSGHLLLLFISVLILKVQMLKNTKNVLKSSWKGKWWIWVKTARWSPRTVQLAGTILCYRGWCVLTFFLPRNTVLWTLFSVTETPSFGILWSHYILSYFISHFWTFTFCYYKMI